MDNITIGIIVVIVILFLSVIYVYKDLDEKVETLEKERRGMETRIIDEISDLKKVANKASAASAAATATAATASETAKSVKENFSISRNNHAFQEQRRHAPPSALGAPSLPIGMRTAISSAKDLGAKQENNHLRVAQEMYDPMKDKTQGAHGAQTGAPGAPGVPDVSGMVEAPMPQLPNATQPIPQIFPNSGSQPSMLPGVNYEAISRNYEADGNFLVDTFDFELGDPDADLYLN